MTLHIQMSYINYELSFSSSAIDILYKIHMQTRIGSESERKRERDDEER